MDNKRLLLLAIFVYSMFMLWDAWRTYTNPPPATPPVAASTAPAKDASIPSPQPAAGVPGTGPAAVPAAAPASRGDIVTVRTDLYTAEISSVGGDIVGLELNNYKASEGNADVLSMLSALFKGKAGKDEAKKFSLFEAKHQYAAQSGLIGDGLPNHKTTYTVAGGKRELAADGDKVELRLEAPAVDGVKVARILTFTPGSYLIKAAYEISNGGQKEVAAHAYYQMQRDTVAPAGGSGMASTFTGPALYTEQDKFQKISFDDVLDGSAKFTQKADDGWISMLQHYFVAAWVPQEKVPREYYVRKLDGDASPRVAAGVIVPVPAVAPGSKLSHEVSLYAGPQLQATLDRLSKPVAEGGIGAAGLPLVVDYGWLTIIAAPLFWCLEALHKLVGNWGWAIVLLTVAIKALFFPLSAASYKSMAKMRAIAPRLQALKERCGDDRQKLNVEMMNIYKTEKINPLGGCLPMVVQIPVFLALYWVLLGAVEMRDAPWAFWIHDLSSMDPYFILPLLMVVSMWYQTTLNPTPPDPIQAKVSKFMPLIFGVMFFLFPSGLVLYWVVNNILSIAQQWQITRMIERGGQAANDAKA